MHNQFYKNKMSKKGGERQAQAALLFRYFNNTLCVCKFGLWVGVEYI